MVPFLNSLKVSRRRSEAAAVIALLGVAAAVGAKAQYSPAMPSTPEARKAAHMPYTTPTVKRNLYPPIDEASADVQKAIAEATREHKRVLLDFGGDWCGDCQVLDIYFNQAPNAELLAKNFVKVNINIGHEDANVELAKKYGVPLEGVPALAVLDSHGKLLYAQDKQFSDMRYMEPQSVTDFLNKWKAKK